jgi:hypothetical protein
VEAVMRAATIMMILFVLRSIGTAAPASATTRADAEQGADHANAAGSDQAAPDAVLAAPRVPVTGPSIDAVLSAAYTAAGLDRDPGRSWIRRARVAGLLPWVAVRTARNTSWHDEDSEVGHGESLEVRATWRLDRLLFDSHELQIASIQAARRRERRGLATQVIRSYVAWRRAAEGASAAGDDRMTGPAAEAAAELDALTDGWFSNEILRLQRGTSGTRTRRTPAP